MLMLMIDAAVADVNLQKRRKKSSHKKRIISNFKLRSSMIIANMHACKQASIGIDIDIDIGIGITIKVLNLHGE